MTKSKRVIKQTAKGDHIQQVAGDLIIQSSEDIQSAFDDAAGLINKGKAETAQVLLERIWKHHSDTMRPDQKSNCRRLLGCALERQDKREEAGRCFLEAKDIDPTLEKAMAFEAVGYVCLGNPAKAYTIAESVLQKFSQNTVAWSVWIRNASDRLSFGDIQEKVPKHLQKDAEVVMALAVAAAVRGDYETAENLVAEVRKQLPESPRVIETLADMMFQHAAINEQVHHERKPSDKERSLLQQAIDLYTRALKKRQEEGSVSGIIRVRLRRAWTHAGLSEYKKSKADVEAAYEIGSDDPQVAYSYAAFIADENLDGAIEALTKVVGKDEKPGVEHLLAQMLHRRNRGQDQKDAIAFLKSRLKDLGSIPENSRWDYIDLLIQLERELSGIECAMETLKTLSTEVIGGRLQAILRSESLWHAGDKGNALRIAKDLYAELDEKTSFDDKRRVANLMQTVGLHREALSLWKGIVRSDCIGTDTYRMIDCARHSGADKEILELSAGLRDNRIWDKNIFEHEIYLRQKYNDWRNCKQILKHYVENPLDEEYLPYARVHLSHVAAALGEIDLIETDLSHLPSPCDVKPGMGRMIVQALRMGGEPFKAVNFAYELVRKNWHSLDVHLTMANFILPMGSKHLELDLPTVVGQGTAVQYEETRAGVKTWHIIEDSKSGVPEALRNEYSVDHPYSERMLGLKKGDTFLLRGGEIQERRATILGVISKYHYRITDCLDGLEDRFQDSTPVLKINAFREDGQIDLDPMKRLADNRHRQGEELLKFYRKQPLPVYFLASKMGRDLLTTLLHVISEEHTEVQCRLGHADEAERALQALEDVEEIVVDEMTLATLLTCSVSEHLIKIPKKLVVSEGTLFNIQNWEVMRVDPGNPGGSFGMIDGHLTLTSTSKEGVEEVQSKIKELIRFIQENCSVESGVALSDLESSNRSNLVEVVGQACTESMALACAGQRVFWTDDFASSALLAAEFGGRRVWTQCVFEHFSKQGFIDIAIVHQLTLKLVSFGYWFTSLNAESAIEAIAESEWDIERTPLKRVLGHFGDARVNLDANFMLMIGKLLKHCWTEDRLGMRASNVTVRLLNELAKRGNTPILVMSLWICLQRIFGPDVLTLQQIKKLLNNWLAGRGGGIVVP